MFHGVVVYQLSKCNTTNPHNASEVKEDNITELQVENFTPVYSENHTFDYNVSLDGRKVSILCVEAEKMWHYDASWNNDYVSAKWQPDDEFVQFMFELQTDGSYKIKAVEFIYLMGMAFPDPSTLNGKDHQDDDHARFLVTMITKGFYRIQNKATKRFLRLDENLMVSSVKNLEDERALFKFIEVQ